MHFVHFTLVLLLCSLLSPSASYRIPLDLRVIMQDLAHFCYDDTEPCGPSKWAGICNGGNKKRQSPIDITTPADPGDRVLTLQFTESYKGAVKEFYARNNGHSIFISLTEDTDHDDEAPHPAFSYVNGDDVKGYYFSNIHFHWGPNNKEGSEHTLNSQAYPMELHLVHYATKYEGLSESVGDKMEADSLSVIGVFVEVKDDCRNGQIFEPVIKAMRSITMQKTMTKIKGQLHIFSFLPKTMDFFSYEGSLTTPSCKEAVRWTVVKEPICISDKDLQAFRALKVEAGKNLLTNHRPVQDLASRKVTFYKAKVTSEGSALTTNSRVLGIFIFMNALYNLT